MHLWLTKEGMESSGAAEISSRTPAGGVVGRVEVELEVVEGGSRATGQRKRRMEVAEKTRRPQVQSVIAAEEEATKR